MIRRQRDRVAVAEVRVEERQESGEIAIGAHNAIGGLQRVGSERVAEVVGG